MMIVVFLVTSDQRFAAPCSTSKTMLLYFSAGLVIHTLYKNLFSEQTVVRAVESGSASQNMDVNP